MISVFRHSLTWIKSCWQRLPIVQAPGVMSIPANIDQGTLIRPARSGPVFSTHGNNCLHMRYTAAVSAPQNLLAADASYIYRLTLQSGWGLVSNNVLHDRKGFDDDPQHPRRLYRLRYFNRVTD